LSVWVTSAGVDIRTVGLIGLVGIIYSLKILWAPFIDRYRLRWLGRRRGWMLATQLALVVGIAAMGLADPRSSLSALIALAVVVTFLSATQDIASDAYRTDVLSTEERGAGSAVFVLGYRMAMILAGGVALILSDHLPWMRVYQIMAALMIVGVVATWLAPEPAAAASVPRTLREAVVEPVRDYFGRRGAATALAFILLYKFGDYLASELIGPFLSVTGFTNTEIGIAIKFMGTAATILGTLAGGGLVAKMGVRRALLAFGILQAAVNVGYLALALVGKNQGLLYAAIGIDCFCGGLATAAFLAFLMALCNRAFSATQYALLSSASALLGRLVGGSSGYIVTAMGWPGFFALTMVIAVPALLLLGLSPIVPAEEPGAAQAA
jgi:PAT family beta-lactamase induction signal transducer AmpG